MRNSHQKQRQKQRQKQGQKQLRQSAAPLNNIHQSPKKFCEELKINNKQDNSYI